jgi:4-amino-4-deoxy-L-arabinose transferase-like glycosyltransferase
LSSALLFSLVVSSVFLKITKEVNLHLGLFSPLPLVTMPRVFGHAHIAVTDMPMMVFLWFSVLAIHKSLQEPKWRYVFALLLGLA